MVVEMKWWDAYDPMEQQKGSFETKESRLGAHISICPQRCVSGPRTSDENHPSFPETSRLSTTPCGPHRSWTYFGRTMALDRRLDDLRRRHVTFIAKVAHHGFSGCHLPAEILTGLCHHADISVAFRPPARVGGPAAHLLLLGTAATAAACPDICRNQGFPNLRVRSEWHGWRVARAGHVVLPAPFRPRATP